MNHNVTSTGNGDFQVESPLTNFYTSPKITPLAEPEEKLLLDIMVQRQFDFNFKHHGASFYANSTPFAQTSKGDLAIVEPFWHHAVIFESHIAEITRLSYNASISEPQFDQLSQHEKDVQSKLTSALQALINNLFAYHSNSVREVQKLLYAAYVAGTSSERLYAGIGTVNLARQLIAYSINSKQNQAPLFFGLFQRLSCEMDFSLKQLDHLHAVKLGD